MRCSEFAFFVALAAAPAFAQTDVEAAATNYQLAVDTCLWNYHDAAGLVPAFQSVGFAVTPHPTADGTHLIEAFGVSGTVTPRELENGCTIQSGMVPFAQGVAIVQSVAAARFGDTVEQGHPENLPTECPMLSIFAPRRMLIVESMSAGNSGECTDPATSSMLMR